MIRFWSGLTAITQDIAGFGFLLLPTFLIGIWVLRGFFPWPLIAAILARYRWPSVMFILLIAISTGMGIGLLAQERGLRQGSAAAADKFDLVIAAPGSEVTMLMASVFLQPSDAPLLDGAVFAKVAADPRVSIAAPLAFGDSFKGAALVGTTVEFLNHLSDGEIDGRPWQDHFEAVIGADVDLEIGAEFIPAHGVGITADHHAHPAAAFLVVGRMGRSNSPWDRAILTPIEAIWEVHGLANGHAPEHSEQLGGPFDAKYFPGTPAIIVNGNGLGATYALRSEFTREADTMAFFPGTVLANLHRIMGDVRLAMSLMSLITQMLVGASVLLGLFILSQLFQRQLAVLSALGAPLRFVLSVVWGFACVLILSGAVLGLALGYLSAAGLSFVVTQRTGITVPASVGWSELHLIAAFGSFISLLSLLPALAVLRRSVDKSLRA